MLNDVFTGRLVAAYTFITFPNNTAAMEGLFYNVNGGYVLLHTVSC